MASIDTLKAPSLVSKKTQKELQKDSDGDEVLIDTNAVPEPTTEDMAVDSTTTTTDSKPNFAPASTRETKVIP